RRALGEGQLHDIPVGFAGADDAAVRPNRRAGFGWFDPLPLLDDVRVCLRDQLAHSAGGLPAPVPEFGDSFRDQPRCRLALARTCFFHVLILARGSSRASVRALRRLAAYGSTNKYRPLNRSKASGRSGE